MTNNWSVGDTVRIKRGEHAGKFGNVIIVHSDGIVISVSLNGAGYAFNHNELESTQNTKTGIITIEETPDGTWLLRDGKQDVLYDTPDAAETAIRYEIDMEAAQVKIERLESIIANLEIQIAEMHAAAMWKAGNGRTYCKACKGNWGGDVICPFERKEGDNDE